MHWTIARVVWFRELRDLLRDRRTLFMILGLPTLLYPLMGLFGYQFALNSLEQTSTVGIVGAQHLPGLSPTSAGFSPVPAVALLTMTPNQGVNGFAGALALMQAARASEDYPPLVIDGHFPAGYWDYAVEGRAVSVVDLPTTDREPLVSKRIDAMLVVPETFQIQLDAGGRPTLEILVRDADERSRVAERRLRAVLGHWKKRLLEVRLRKHGLPADFDDPVAVRTPQQDAEPLRQTTEELTDLVARFFPFMLIMWSMAGALYPSIDVCAGEKERGTLETLLLSPATRGEIVVGKFLAVWTFSAGTALWNLAWMGVGAWASSTVLPFSVVRLSSLAWSALLTLLLSALFSAVSLALGAYAKSTKEGQYYLLPLFLVAMPLTMLPMIPGVELNVWFSLIPITGVVLLLQRLMGAAPDSMAAWYIIPVLLSLAASIALTLAWAIRQFSREEVLFRHSTGMGWRQWLKKLVGWVER